MNYKLKGVILILILSISIQSIFAQKVHKMYDDDGNLYSTAISEDDSPNGKVDWVYYFENGNIRKKGRTINFKNVGEWKVYYENGQVKEVQNYTIDGKSTGIWNFYYQNGQLFMTGRISNGQNTGEWKIFHKNGQLAKKGMFLNGKPSGKWEVYDENGDLVKTEFYE